MLKAWELGDVIADKDLRNEISEIAKGFIEEALEPNPHFDVGTFSKFSFPLIRRAYPKLIANELVKVQPMSAPTAALLYFKHKYGGGKK